MANPETTPIAEKTQEVSSNPLDYLAMILYVKDGVPACDRLKAQASARMDVLVQNVDLIQGEKPSWLTGVPTVVLLPSRTIVTGTGAIKEVAELCQSSLAGVNGFHSGLSGNSASIATLGDGDAPGEATAFNSLFTCQDDDPHAEELRAPSSALLGADPRYEDKPREKQNDTSLEDIMRRRGDRA
jgi:hypothetical protein